MIRRDYIERMIADCVAALVRIAHFVRTGEFDLALEAVRETSESVLGPYASVVPRLDATSAVVLVGQELDRLRLHAQLLFEEAAIHDLRGHADRAAAARARALGLYRALRAAGCALHAGDEERITAMEQSLPSG